MSRGRFYWARGPRCVLTPGPVLFFRRLWGDLVRWPAPGLAPSPGRSWLPAAAAVPINAFAATTIADPLTLSRRHFPALPLAGGGRGQGAQWVGPGPGGAR
ncbi:MAG: hypothetical protein ACRDOD_18785, partial [Streptosporangiaceae bacterium]